MREKAFWVQSFFGYLNMFLSVLNGLILVPLYINKVGSNWYGYWITINNLMLFFTIISFGNNSLFVQRLSSATAKNDKEIVYRYFFTFFIVNIFLIIIYFLTGIILLFYIKGLLNLKNLVNIGLIKKTVFLCLCAYCINFLNNFIKGFFWGIMHPFKIELSFLIGKMIGIIVVVVVLFYFKSEIIAFPLGLLSTEIFSFVCGILFINEIISIDKSILNISKYVTLEYLKEIRNIGPFLFLSMLGNKSTELIYSLILTRYISPEITTSYTIYKKIADLIFHILNIINASSLNYFSHLFSSETLKKIKRQVKSAILIFTFFAILFYTLYILFNKLFISFWFKKTIIELDGKVIVLLGVAMIIYSTNRFLRSILYSINEFKLTSIVVFGEGFLFSLLIYLFIKKMGIIIIPLALFIVSIISFSLFFFLIQKYIFKES